MSASASIYPWHKGVWQQVQAARTQQHLPHALLFSGQDGCGHEVFVQVLAQSLLCLQPDAEGMACGQCRSCHVFVSKAHPDFTQVSVPEDKQVIGVDQIRVLGHFLELSCSYSPCRVAVIMGAEHMNVNAANSLLKPLEEPSAHSHILLFSLKPAELLPTVRSRCQLLRLPLPSHSEAIHWLEQKNPVQAPELLLKLANGKPLAALAQDSGEKLVQRLLFLQQLAALLSGKAVLSELSAHWEKQPRAELLDWQLQWLHAVLRGRYSGAGEGGQDAEALFDVCVAISNRGLWGLYERLLELKPLAAHPLNARLFVENMLSLWLQVRVTP